MAASLSTFRQPQTAMGHLLVFASILILTTGFAVLYQGILMYRAYRFPALRSFVIYVAIANLMELITVLMQYVFRNVHSLTSDERYIVVFVIMGFIGFTFAAIEIAFFASTVMHLSGRTRSPRWSVYTFGYICAAWLVSFCVGSYRFFYFGDKYFLRGVLEASTPAVAACFAILALLLLFSARDLQPDPRRRLVRMFGLFFFSLTFLDLCSLFLPTHWSDSFLMLSELAMNLGLLISLKPFVISYYGPLAPATDLNHYLDRFCAKFRLSARERDLLQMIVKGKSNRDIEQLLFISRHTVKNHIYHIFRKTGNNSRGQLVRMVVQSFTSLPD